MATKQTGFDELLFDRVKQLKEIQERLSDAIRIRGRLPNTAWDNLITLNNDLAWMILQAETEHAAF
jgi:hypothetical protein